MDGQSFAAALEASYHQNCDHHPAVPHNAQSTVEHQGQAASIGAIASPKKRGLSVLEEIQMRQAIKRFLIDPEFSQYIQSVEDIWDQVEKELFPNV